jgi:hypothetical protein
MQAPLEFQKLAAAIDNITVQFDIPKKIVSSART